MPEIERTDPDAEEVQVVIAKTCHYRGQDNKVIVLKPGVHMVSPEIANNWFVLAHTNDPPPPELTPGTKQYAAAQLAKAARKRLLEAATAQLAEEKLAADSAPKPAAKSYGSKK